MTAILSALAPIFLLIALGDVLRRLGMPGEGFWPPAEKLTYYVLFPSLLLHSLATAPLGGLAVLPAALALSSAVLIMSGITLGVRPDPGSRVV